VRERVAKKRFFFSSPFFFNSFFENKKYQFLKEISTAVK
jgi:hypothetical protein